MLAGRQVTPVDGDQSRGQEPDHGGGVGGHVGRGLGSRVVVQLEEPGLGVERGQSGAQVAGVDRLGEQVPASGQVPAHDLFPARPYALGYHPLGPLRVPAYLSGGQALVAFRNGPGGIRLALPVGHIKNQVVRLSAIEDDLYDLLDTLGDFGLAGLQVGGPSCR